MPLWISPPWPGSSCGSTSTMVAGGRADPPPRELGHLHLHYYRSRPWPPPPPERARPPPPPGMVLCFDWMSLCLAATATSRAVGGERLGAVAPPPPSFHGEHTTTTASPTGATWEKEAAGMRWGPAIGGDSIVPLFEGRRGVVLVVTNKRGRIGGAVGGLELVHLSQYGRLTGMRGEKRKLLEML